MELGLFVVSTDQMMSLGRIAQEAERRGFASIFTGEHSHLPVGAQLWSGGDFPEHYKRFLDPFLALTHAAALTQRIKLGTAVSLVAIHDPILLAKTVATLDHLSDGRFIFGVGYGYVEVELRDHGVDPKFRRGILREKILAMQELWSNEIASYSGKYVSFQPCWHYPKPRQTPWPRILIGGALSTRTLEHITEFGDGWIPTAMMAGDQLATEIVRLRAQAEKAGRDPMSMDVTVFHTARSGQERRGDDWGAEAITADAIDNYEATGVTTLCLPVPSADEDVVLPLLDRYAAIAGSRIVNAAAGGE